jgi:predicted Zn-dependent protease
MYTLNGDLHSGTIKILTKSFSSVLPLTDNRIRYISLHEIGHALGLSGHTDNPEDIMFLSTSFKDEWRELTPRDARTIQRFYSSK